MAEPAKNRTPETFLVSMAEIMAGKAAKAIVIRSVITHGFISFFASFFYAGEGWKAFGNRIRFVPWLRLQLSG